MLNLFRCAAQEAGLLNSQRQPGRAGEGGASSRSRSTLDDFAQQHSAYGDMAAGVMARVRSRLMGYMDGASAAEAVLQELVEGASCREERAALLADAFTPPGLRLEAAEAASSSGGGSGSMGGGQDAGAPRYACTTPTELLQAIAARQQQQAAAGLATGAGSGGRGDDDGGGGGGGQQLEEVLAELAEDVEEYDRHIYSQRSGRGRYGDHL